MDFSSKIFVAGHRGMVGSAIHRKLSALGYKNIITRTHKELDLTRQADTEQFFKAEQPDIVILAAARVGGILANSTYKADFIYENIAIAANVIHASYLSGVKKMLNLGSTCIYPKQAQQPMKEESLLTGVLEQTNEPYAIAKIAAIKLCRYYNEQYKTNFMSVMPTNLYGPNDNYDFEKSHVLPALIRKFHLAKLLNEKDYDGIIADFKKFGQTVAQSDIEPTLAKFGVTANEVKLWGSGKPYREFLHADDLADACVFLLRSYNAQDIGEFINIGIGQDYSLKEIAAIVQKQVGFQGAIAWDTTKPDGTFKKLSDSTRITALGWKPKISLTEGIASVYGAYCGQTTSRAL